MTRYTIPIFTDHLLIINKIQLGVKQFINKMIGLKLLSHKLIQYKFIMKYTNIIPFISLILLITSCSTTEKFSVVAPTGTKIYTPNNKYTPKGISYGNKIKIEIPSDMYCGFILAKTSDSDLEIPIGVDYMTKRHQGTKFALYTGGIIEVIGASAVVGAAVTMGAMAIGGSEVDPMMPILGAGAAASALGAAIYCPAENRLDQISYNYNFGYEKIQTIRVPTLSSKLLNPNPPKDGSVKASKSKSTTRKKASSGKEVTPEESSTSSKVSSSRTDNARKVQGTYTGRGKLMYGKSVDEKYDEISVIIERIDKTHVNVRIIESGEDYFDTPLTYVVKKEKSGNYSLKIDKLPEASIIISSKGELTFLHKKVNIDSQIYTLEIIGEKE